MTKPYIAPEITTLTPSPEQRQVIEDVIRWLHRDTGAFAILSQGRGAGKSTLRALIAQRILDGDAEPLYEVRPIVHRESHSLAVALSGPHSRACGIRMHAHGAECSSNCPTCGGQARAW